MTQPAFNQPRLDSILRSFLSKEIKGITLAAAHDDQRYLGACGDLRPDSQFFIASSTKLYITALVLQLVDSKRLSLGDRIATLLPGEITDRLHVFKGVDYTQRLTVAHLLSHTSGLPDYFQAIRESRTSLMNQILAGEDQKWDLAQVVRDSKILGAVFAPDSGKALYSDTNFQLLGAIIERSLDSPLSQVIDQHICQKLGLVKTYVYQDENDQRPAPLNYGTKKLRVPQAMTSFGADGGIVSTAADGVEFLKGFFEGHLFNPAHVERLTEVWRHIFFPMRYGVGVSLFRLPWFFSPFKRIPDLVGHSGLSGAFLFHCPDKRLYLSGTVNQLARPQTSFKLMIKVMMDEA